MLAAAQKPVSIKMLSSINAHVQSWFGSFSGKAQHVPSILMEDM
jgi:hypothetical protein